MNKQVFGREEQLLLSVLRGYLNERVGEASPGIIVDQDYDWERLKSIAVMHGVAPFLWPRVRHCPCGIPPAFATFLAQRFYLSLQRDVFLGREFLRIAEEFARASLEMVPFKGMAFLHDIYRDMPVRGMTDMDVLIKAGDLPRATDVMYALGYSRDLAGLDEKYWLTRQMHMVFHRRDAHGERLIVEVHWRLDYPRPGVDLLPRLWERLRQIDFVGTSIRVMSPEDNLFSLALHARRWGNILQIKNVFDVAMIIKRFPGLDWEYVRCEASRAEMHTSLHFIFLQAQELLAMSIPEHILRKLRPGTMKGWLLRRLIRKSTFAVSNSKTIQRVFVKAHFLLYDSWWEPVRYILRIPPEQFARYFHLKPYFWRSVFLKEPSPFLKGN